MCVCVIERERERDLFSSFHRITQICGVYGKGRLSLKNAYLYIGIMNGISQMIALHSLIYFYKGTRPLLKPIHPVGKFLSVKAIVFFTFW